jgi:hypothetical protein
LEAEFERIMVQGQFRQIVCKTQSQQIPGHSGMPLLPQDIQEAENGRIMFPGQIEPKIKKCL